jgi:hypothetical protein
MRLLARSQREALTSWSRRGLPVLQSLRLPQNLVLVQDGGPSVRTCKGLLFSRRGCSVQLFERSAPRCPFPAIENSNGPIRQQFHPCEHFDPGPNSLGGSGNGIGMLPDADGPIVAAGCHGLLSTRAISTRILGTIGLIRFGCETRLFCGPCPRSHPRIGSVLSVAKVKT